MSKRKTTEGISGGNRQKVLPDAEGVSGQNAQKVLRSERPPPEGKLGVFDDKGRQVGHVGPRATEATAARLLGKRGAKLTKKDGRPVWCL